MSLPQPCEKEHERRKEGDWPPSSVEREQSENDPRQRNRQLDQLFASGKLREVTPVDFADPRVMP
jgi:hypothetical protein